MFDNLFERLRQQVNERDLAAGRFYHVSPRDLGDRVTMTPRTPKKIGSEPRTKRVCVAPTVEGCMVALGEILNTARVLYVYRTVDTVDSQSTKGVVDADITGERWLRKPVAFEKVGVVNMSDLPEQLNWDLTRLEPGEEKDLRWQRQVMADLEDYLRSHPPTKRNETTQYDIHDRLFRIRESGLPPEQEELKKRVRPSMELTPSTWSGEEKWYKFLILNDGSVIPVEKSHRGTIVGRDLVPGPLFSEEDQHYHNTKHAATQRKFYDTGAAEGKYAPAVDEFGLYWDNELTDEQIEAAVELFKKYPARKVYANGTKGLEVDSADRFEAILRYGEEMAMAESVCESETHDKIRSEYGTVEPGELKNSLWPGDFGRFRKFLILADGGIVPVKEAHWVTIMGASGEEWESRNMAEMPEFVHQFRRDHGIQGTVTSDELALYTIKDIKFSTAQLRSIIGIYNKYRPKRLVIDWNEYGAGGKQGTDWEHSFIEVEIDSAERLEAVLQYGPEMATANESEEGHAAEMDWIEQHLRDTLKQDELGLSTDNWEGTWMKFLILRDGTLLAVDKYHSNALTSPSGKGYATIFNQEGGVQGRYDASYKELDLFYPRIREPNAEQMKTIEKLANQFHPAKLTIDSRDDHVHTDVESTDEIVYIVKWGSSVVAGVEEKRVANERKSNP